MRGKRRFSILYKVRSEIISVLFYFYLATLKYSFRWNIHRLRRTQFFARRVEDRSVCVLNFRHTRITILYQPAKVDAVNQLADRAFLSHGVFQIQRSKLMWRSCFPLDVSLLSRISFALLYFSLSLLSFLFLSSFHEYARSSSSRTRHHAERRETGDVV